MSKTVNANHTGLASPGSTFNSRISADADAFDRNDVDALGHALDNQNHDVNKGLPVVLRATTVISGGGTLTWPTSTDTMVGRATTDTLTNKTLTAPNVTGGLTVTGDVLTTGSTSNSAANGLQVRNLASSNLFTVRNDGLVTVNAAAGAAGGLTVTGSLTLATAISKVVPGATSLSLRNNADNADNLIITDAGRASFRIGADVLLSATTTMATTATDGFPVFPSCAGTPTGVPTNAVSGRAMVIDSTANKIWVYVNAAWKSAALT